MAFTITRSSTEHSILEQPAIFSKKQLPTSADVFREYDYYLKNEKWSSAHERATLVAHEIKEIYDTSSIPSIEVNSIVIRIKRLVSKVHELCKYSDAKKSSATYHESLGRFYRHWKIFLISVPVSYLILVSGIDSNANVL